MYTKDPDRRHGRKRRRSPLPALAGLLPAQEELPRYQEEQKPPTPRPLPGWSWLLPLIPLAIMAFIVITSLVPIHLSWRDPANIPYGTALSDRQLNATANLPGQFVYTPGLATVLNAGKNQALVASFQAESLPSPRRELAIGLGLLALLATLALAVRTWPRRPIEPAAATAVDVRRGSRLTSSLAVLICLGLLGATLVYYLIYPRTAAIAAHITVDQAIPVIDWADPAPIVYPTRLDHRQLKAAASAAGALSYTPGLDTLLGAGPGQTLSVAFAPADATDYAPVSKTVHIDVAKGTPQLTWQDSFALLYGALLGPDQLDARATVPGTLTYNLDSASPLAAGQYDLIASFHPADAADWNDVTRSARLTVGQASLAITWSAPPPITYPGRVTPGHYSFTVAPTVPGTPTFTPPVGALLDVGQHQLAIRFQPADAADYAAATATAMVTVAAGRPVIIWHDPTAITYPTPLGDAQLDATADVAGKFTYDPPAGTVLAPGTDQALNVTFQPDSANYQAVSAAVHINVRPVDTGGEPHQAQFLKNGDFEGGFTIAAPATAVGTGWCYFNNGDYHFGYYDDAWAAVWYNAGHSQLIEIGSPDYNPGDRPGRLAGICQPISGLIPGQSYALTLHGVLRASGGDADLANGSFVAEWGLATGATAAWQDVAAWQLVPWTRVDPHLAPGPVQSYVTHFVAPADRLTLFIGLLKRPGKGNLELNLNLDGLALTGPTDDPALTLRSR